MWVVLLVIVWIDVLLCMVACTRVLACYTCTMCMHMQHIYTTKTHQKHTNHTPTHPTHTQKNTHRSQWQDLQQRLSSTEQTVAAASGGMAFEFVEGQLVQAVTQGHWLLLDEINLAPAEVCVWVFWRGGLVLLCVGGWFCCV